MTKKEPSTSNNIFKRDYHTIALRMYKGRLRTPEEVRKMQSEMRVRRNKKRRAKSRGCGEG
mgnify:CR=1 FL=1